MSADIKDGFCVFDGRFGDAVLLLDEDFVVEGLLVFPELGRGSWHGWCLVKAVEGFRGLWREAFAYRPLIFPDSRARYLVLQEMMPPIFTTKNSGI